jgi:hypothetical protein
MNKFLTLMSITPLALMVLDAEGGEGAPGAGASGVLTPEGTPGAGGGEPVKAPWSGAEGVYKIGEGEQAKPWWDGIEEAPIRDYMEEKQYATPDDAARAAWHANKLAKDPNAIVMPAKDAPKEQWDSFYNKMGRPAEANAYELKLPEGADFDKSVLEFTTPKVKELLHKLGATPDKAQEVYSEWVAMEQELMALEKTQYQEENTKALEALEQKWKAQGNLQGMQKAGQTAAQALGYTAEEIDQLSDVLGDARVVDLFARIGSAVPEGKFKDGGTNNADPSNPETMTPDQAKEAIATLRSDAEFNKKLNDKNEPGHEDALKRLEKLYAKASPKS